MVIAGVLAPNFFTTANLMNILKQASVVSIVAIGMGMVLISGCMDLTVGVNMAICSILAMTMQKYVGVAGAMLVALITGAAIGLINFFVVHITRARVVEIMLITFGLKMAYRGLAQALTGNVTFREDTTEFFSNIGKGQTGIFPNIVLIMLGVAVIVGVVLARTRFGREVVCIGNNPEASRLSGISIPRTRLKCFLVAGICCAVAGILLASRTRAGTVKSYAQISLQPPVRWGQSVIEIFPKVVSNTSCSCASCCPRWVSAACRRPASAQSYHSDKCPQHV